MYKVFYRVKWARDRHTKCGGMYHVPQYKDGGASSAAQQAYSLLCSSLFLLKIHPPTTVHGAKKRRRIKRKREEEEEDEATKGKREQKKEQKRARKLHPPLTGQAGTKIPNFPIAICHFCFVRLYGPFWSAGCCVAMALMGSVSTPIHFHVRLFSLRLLCLLLMCSETADPSLVTAMKKVR